MIVNLSASDELAGKDTYRRNLVSSQSARLVCGYIYASAGPGESTQDVVYGGHDLIAENGIILQKAGRFENGAVYGIMDIHKLNNERRRMTTCGFARQRKRRLQRGAVLSGKQRQSWNRNLTPDLLCLLLKQKEPAAARKS